MTRPFPTSTNISRLALCAAVAAGLSFASIDADAQRGGGKPSGGSYGGKPGWSGGGHGNWNGGGRGNWNGGGHGNWNGGGRHWHGGHGNHWGGHHHHGWYRGRYYYPGWALGLGVGVGLTYPWWGWGWSYPYAVSYPSSFVGIYEAPVGIVVDRPGPPSAPAPAYRWYCPSPQGYHPDVVECAAGWLKVLPPDAHQPSAPLPPRSSAPDGVTPRVAPDTMGNAAPPRIAAPRMTRPTQLAGVQGSPERIAQSTAD